MSLPKPRFRPLPFAYKIVGIMLVSCFLLIGLILIQRSKNEGMGGLAMGAGMGEALFGSRAGNVLTRAQFRTYDLLNRLSAEIGAANTGPSTMSPTNSDTMMPSNSSSVTHAGR